MEGQRLCQCCGMPMPTDDLLGTRDDGSRDTDYCVYCLIDGRFNTSTLEVQIECNLRFVDEFNKDMGTSYTVKESRRMLEEFLPQLKRWKGQ